MRRFVWWIGGVVVLCSEVDANAAPCDCDLTLELDVGIADGAALGVQPGQSVCVRGGPREYLRLQKFTGTVEQPIVIRNCEGVVDISNDDRGYALTVDGSRHVHVTGTGDEASTYGFRARAARTGPDYSGMSVAVGELSSDIELDHVEAYEAGFAGIMWQTNPRCDLSANLGEFVMENSRIHHNWMHDTGGEGLYFGSTGYGGREYTCNGEKVTLYPHELHGADIHDNIFETTGWDGAQIGVTPKGCAFYNNTVRDVGLAGELYQQQGLQIGGASTCVVSGNTFMDGPTNGVFVLGADDTFIFNNLIVNFGDAGIYASDQNLDLAAQFQIAFNTVIVGAGKRGIAVFGPKLGPGYAFNNVVVGPNPIGVAGDIPDFTQSMNHTAEAPDALGFVDAASRDYHLREDSQLRDAGAALPNASIDVDLDGAPRSDGAPDIGAFEWSPEPPPSDDTTGSPETSDTADTADAANATGEPEPDTTSASSPGGATDGDESNLSDSLPTGASTFVTTSETTASIDTATTPQAEGGDGCGCTATTAPPMLALLPLLPRRRKPR